MKVIVRDCSLEELKVKVEKLKLLMKDVNPDRRDFQIKEIEGDIILYLGYPDIELGVSLNITNLSKNNITNGLLEYLYTYFEFLKYNDNEFFYQSNLFENNTTKMYLRFEKDVQMNKGLKTGMITEKNWFTIQI